MPESGGDTLFASLAAAYDDLSAAMKETLGRTRPPPTASSTASGKAWPNPAAASDCRTRSIAILPLSIRSCAPIR